MQVIKVAAAKIIIFVASVIWFVLTYDLLSAEKMLFPPSNVAFLLFTAVTIHTHPVYHVMISTNDIQ